ncbi:ABC transporter permease subunit [Rhodobacteraceae bacterium 2CG4]|uniref:ABC transporter permease subunit n=1 Tax=Halovulum marinum TaxID=2662447 RepID=A0A6L5Z4T4_9RHOB|nr:ABC transporter permease subunit [Halovulum marinum]MSU91581.1 ABC transporter permease subunit [Halovulum marinum]
MSHVAGSPRMSWRRWLVVAIPMLWLGVFFLLPFIEVARISLADPALARPPYTAIWADGRFTGDLENFLFLLSDSLYVNAYLSSIRFAFVSTVLALLIGYPMAYAIARAREPWRTVLLFLVILPFWTSFLLRVYALVGLMNPTGPINQLLLWLGLIGEPLVMRQTDFAVYVGIVYTYLPFMILPLYAVLSKLDDALLEASADLGAHPAVTFLTVTLPLSLPGVVAGAMLVFIPSIGEFVIPALLGGPDTLMIGQVLWNEFFSARDWTVASAVAVAMLLLIVLPILWLQKMMEPAR